MIAETTRPVATGLHLPARMATTSPSLNLAPPLLTALVDFGYEAPTAIQARTMAP